MAPPPPPKYPTTVLDLDDDLLREVFLRLPTLPSLVRAALACRTFLRAVRSSPAFRRTFRALHPSPFVGLFIQRRWEPELPSFDAHHHRSDRDFAAAVCGGDFSLTGLPFPDGDDENKDEDEENYEEEDTNEEDENNEKEDSDEDDYDEEEDENSGEEEDDDNASPVWEIERCCDGYVVLFNRRAKQIAAYNPLTRALHLFHLPPHVFFSPLNFEFHIISSQDDPGMPIRVVYFYSGGFQALVGVISSDSSTDEWKIFPKTASGVTGKMVNGSVYWTDTWKPYITVLNTATLQFTKMDLPTLLAEQQGCERAFVLGNTKVGRPCIVSPDLGGGCSLDVYFWRRDE